ncbi:hypothetical protein SC1_00244 [Sphingopyxis sp. C-1]|nr:hypothetical protein SC1_00244 [Sphingopyxis sp. C-1]
MGYVRILHATTAHRPGVGTQRTSRFRRDVSGCPQSQTYSLHRRIMRRFAPNIRIRNVPQ